MNSEVTANRDMAVSQALPLPLRRNRDYVLIVVAGAVSAVGTKVSQIALPLLVLGLTQSPVWAGLLGAARLLPYLLISLPAGVWVDRVNRKRLLVACDLVRGWLFATIPLAYYFGILTILQLFVVVFVVGICTVLFEVAEGHTLLGRRDLVIGARRCARQSHLRTRHRRMGHSSDSPRSPRTRLSARYYSPPDHYPAAACAA